jgi:hypothetical protein
METFFENIQTNLLDHLDQAQKEVLINVPWFTDTLLFDKLLELAKRGIEIHLTIEDDHINENSPINYNDLLLHQQGFLYLNQPNHPNHKLNHEKYCLIDTQYLLYGSYNWTYSANKRNRESIILSDDLNMVNQYKQHFYETIALESVKSIEKPKQEKPILDLIDITTILKSEIYFREAELSILEEEKIDLQQQIELFMNTVSLSLKTLILEKMALITNIALAKATFTNLNEDKAEFNKAEFNKEQTKQTFEKQEKRQEKLNKTLDNENEFKRMFKEAAMMTHPDKFLNEPDKQSLANSIMTALNEAYSSKDFDAVKNIWQKLKLGLTFGDWKQKSDFGLLSQVLDSLIAKIKTTQSEIENLKASEAYQTAARYKNNLEPYIDTLKSKLTLEINLLKKDLEYYKTMSN